MKYSHKRLLSFLFVFIVIVVTCSYFFRYQISSNFDGMMGDVGDARFNTLICEHWYGVFSGNESVLDLRIFYPEKTTLGYSDTLFAYAIPYSLLRALGLDMLRSMQLILILFYLLGATGLFWLLHSKFKIKIPFALFGMAMFVLSNNVFVKSGHTQLFMIGLIPWLFILVYGFFKNINKTRKKRIIYGISAIFLIGIVTFSGFYTAYFTALFMAIFAVVWYICSWLAGEKPILKIFNFIRNNILEVFTYIIFGAVVLMPSIWVYLPVILEFGQRSFLEVMTYLPRWSDFLNVSFDNLALGKFLKLYFLKVISKNGELKVGFPLATLLSFLACVFYFAKRFKNKNFQLNVRLPLAISVSILVIMLLILRIYDFSLWKYIYMYIPGASALRAVSRYNMFLSLPISIVLAFGAEAFLLKWKNGGIIKPILIFIILMIFLLENTMTVTNCYWSIKEQREHFSKVEQPPKTCNIFAITNPKPSAPYIYQLDAWMIADKFNLYTINGYSGQFPRGWENLWDPTNLIIYRQGIQEWVQNNNLSDICGYDSANNKWIPNLLEQNMLE